MPCTPGVSVRQLSILHKLFLILSSIFGFYLQHTMSKSGKAIIFSAPSGSGKTTIVRHLLKKYPDLGFSISATTRSKRPNETDGKDYYFLSIKDFEGKIKANEFVEWEQVYEGLYYGTLKEEVERIWGEGRHVVFDVDVVGGLNLKKYFGDRGLAIFVRVPDMETLRHRLESRKTETEESLAKRLEKAEYELSFEKKFDATVVNDQLDEAFANAENKVRKFIDK